MEKNDKSVHHKVSAYTSYDALILDQETRQAIYNYTFPVIDENFNQQIIAIHRKRRDELCKFISDLQLKNKHISDL